MAISIEKNANHAPGEQGARQRWMSILAKSEIDALDAAWDKLRDKPAYDFLRRPETGLIMVRGRAGGVGEKFNLGEVTMTRCSVQMQDGSIGHGYIAGRGTRHAELAAVFDALLQNPDHQEALQASLILPLESKQERLRAQKLKAADATKVDFFTMVRGEDDA